MNRTRLRWARLLLVTLISVNTLIPALAGAAPPPQDEDPKAQADALYQEGRALFQAGQLPEALSKFEAALPLFQAAGEREGEAYCLLTMGVIKRNLADYEGAVNAYQAALLLLRELGNQEGEAAALNNLGRVYYGLGQYQEALEHYQQALPILQEIDQPRGLGSVLGNMGSAYHALGQYALALDYFQQALAIQRESGDQSGEGATLNNMGLVYHSLGGYDQALEAYQQALDIDREIGDRGSEGTALNNIGTVYLDLGQYEQAQDYLQQALAVHREVGNLGGEGETLGNIGRVYDQLGEYERALGYHQQALAIHRRIGDRTAEATALNNIGLVYRALGQHEQALETYQQALTIWQEGGNRAGEASTLGNIGLVYAKLGRHEQALDVLGQVLDIHRQIGDRAGEANALANMGGIRYLLGQAGPALDHYQQALTLARDIGDRYAEGAMLNGIAMAYDDLGQHEQALDYLEQALAVRQDIGDRRGEATTLANMGIVHRQQGDIERAIGFYREAIDAIESIQGEIKTEELKASFAGQQVDFYATLIDLLWEEGRFEEVFNYAERARARAFLDQLANGAIDFRAGADAKFLERERALKAEITARRTQLTVLRNRPHDEWDSEAIAAVQAGLSALEADYGDLLVELKLQSPEVAGLVGVDVASLADVQALLDPKVTLVEYFITDDRTLAFVITQDTFEAIPLEVSRGELTGTITDFRDFASLDDPYPASLVQLHAWLIAPLQVHLTGPVLGIIPHSALHYLPFAALTDGQGYLSDDYILFSLPSASALRFIQAERKPGADTLLALGNPTSAEPLPALRFAEQEVEAIADLYGSQALVGTEATESAVWSQASQAGVLHLAAHGEYNPFSPLFSTVHLAADEQNDGRLEVHEVYGLDLTAATDLVVLSACQTQLGELSAGDEVVGLNRAFLYAGTPSVMASLWNVDDAATALLMERFYTHLRARLGKAEALRQAQIDTRAEYPHPYYWAAFVLTGDAGEVNGKVAVRAATPTPTVTEETALQPAAEPTQRRFCPGAALPLGVALLIGVRRKHKLIP